MKIIGIDPGITGALAFIDTDACTIAMRDMPVEVYLKTRKIVATAELMAIFRDIVPDAVFTEEVGVKPGEGAVGAFAFGRGVGRLEGVTDAMQIQRWSIRPQEWKGRLNVKADKELAVTRAKQLIPSAAPHFIGPRGGLKHGRAEASMIALYGAIKLGVTPKTMLIVVDFP